MAEKDKYGYKHDDDHYSKMTGNDTNSSYSIYDKNPAEKDHSATHVNINTDTGKGSIVEHGPDGKTQKTDISCYLTTACMRYMQENFDDNCYELRVLRWFRDNFVSNCDVKHYYNVAPKIVAAIGNENESNLIYNYIYDNVVDYCVTQIENGNYNEAYNRYKDSIQLLEKYYISSLIQDIEKPKSLIKC